MHISKLDFLLYQSEKNRNLTRNLKILHCPKGNSSECGPKFKQCSWDNAKFITKFILTTHDPEIIIDLRKTNRQKEHSKFDEFWDEVTNLFEKYKLPYTKKDMVHIIISRLLYVLENLQKK